MESKKLEVRLSRESVPNLNTKLKRDKIWEKCSDKGLHVWIHTDTFRSWHVLIIACMVWQGQMWEKRYLLVSLCWCKLLICFASV